MYDLAFMMTYGAFPPRWPRWPQAQPGDWVAALVAHADRALDMLPRAGGEVGILLSGGIDSAAVAHLMRHRVGRAFVLDTGGAVAAARPIAEALALPLEVVRVDDVLATSLDDVLWALKQPIHSAAPFAFLPLYRAVAAAGCDTVLTGDGADELFGGHAYHRDPDPAWLAPVPDARSLWEAYARVRRLGIDVSRLLLRRPESPWTEGETGRRVAEAALTIPERDERLRRMDVALRMFPQCVDLQRSLAQSAGLNYIAPFAAREVVASALAAPLESDQWSEGKGPLRQWMVREVGAAWEAVVKAPIRSETGRRRVKELPDAWLARLQPDVIRRHGVFEPAEVARLLRSVDPRSPWLPRALVVVASTHALLERPSLLDR